MAVEELILVDSTLFRGVLQTGFQLLYCFTVQQTHSVGYVEELAGVSLCEMYS